MRRLFKSSTDKKVMGVLGGMGEYFGIDPTILRVGVLLLHWIPITIPAYILLGILLPYDYQVDRVTRRQQSSTTSFYEEVKKQ